MDNSKPMFDRDQIRKITDGADKVLKEVEEEIDRFNNFISTT